MSDDLPPRARAILDVCVIADVTATTFRRFVVEGWTVEVVRQAPAVGVSVRNARLRDDDRPSA